MIRLLVVLFFSFAVDIQDLMLKQRVTGILPTDSIEIDLQPVLDEKGLLDGYQARIFTPICEEDKCYAVEIDFFWDLMGRYVGYDTIPGAPLTKLEHEPLTSEEYTRLDQILGNRSSVLGNYEKEDLVLDIEEEGVDGVSGATITEIKESVITGAVYSCYTLWHIVNGPVVDSIQQKTYSQLNESLVQKLIDLSDQEINYYLINSLSVEDFHKYLGFVLQSIESGQGYYPKNAIEKMPCSTFIEDNAQLFFARKFDSFNYFTQMALLKKLEPGRINEVLSRTLRAHLDDRNSQKSKLISRLVGSGTNP